MKNLIKLIIALIISGVAIYLSLIWFNWKLLVIIILFIWGNNIELTTKYLKK